MTTNFHFKVIYIENEKLYNNYTQQQWEGQRIFLEEETSGSGRGSHIPRQVWAEGRKRTKNTNFIFEFIDLFLFFKLNFLNNLENLFFFSFWIRFFYVFNEFL